MFPKSARNFQRSERNFFRNKLEGGFHMKVEWKWKASRARDKRARVGRRVCDSFAISYGHARVCISPLYAFIGDDLEKVRSLSIVRRTWCCTPCLCKVSSSCVAFFRDAGENAATLNRVYFHPTPLLPRCPAVPFFPATSRTPTLPHSRIFSRFFFATLLFTPSLRIEFNSNIKRAQ